MRNVYRPKLQSIVLKHVINKKKIYLSLNLLTNKKAKYHQKKQPITKPNKQTRNCAIYYMYLLIVILKICLPTAMTSILGKQGYNTPMKDRELFIKSTDT